MSLTTPRVFLPLRWSAFKITSTLIPGRIWLRWLPLVLILDLSILELISLALQLDFVLAGRGPDGWNLLPHG